MDAATLQARIYSGYNKAAQRIGYPFTLYRPKNTGAVLTQLSSAGVPINAIGAPFNASFTVNGSTFNFNKPGTHKDDLWLGLFDATACKVGDYLYNANHGTFFIAALQDQLPILCVKCGSILSVVRPHGSSSVGATTEYSGATPATETAIITGWPGSMSFEARGRNTGANLPMDEQNPFFKCYLPAFPNTDIRPSDIITDNNNRRYVVAASELSPLGWRIMVQHMVS